MGILRWAFKPAGRVSLPTTSGLYNRGAPVVRILEKSREKGCVVDASGLIRADAIGAAKQRVGHRHHELVTVAFGLEIAIVMNTPYPGAKKVPNQTIAPEPKPGTHVLSLELWQLRA
jgi:hypothetical protein